MFTMYLDASGTRLEHDVVTIAGFVSDVRQWLEFEKEWNAVLATFGVPALHMKDFAHSRRAFEGWDRQESKRRAFLDRLSGIIARRTHKSFCRSVRVGDFEVFDRDYPIRETLGTPLAIAGLTVVGGAAMWLKKYGDEEKALFVFEDGDTDKPFLTRALETWSGINPIYRKKHEHVQFQAADWLAYENRMLSARWIDNNEALSQADYRGSVRVLADKLSHDEWGDIGASEFRELCERLQLPTRQQGSETP